MLKLALRGTTHSNTATPVESPAILDASAGDQQIHPNPAADALVQEHLRQVVASVRQSCRPTAILLTGSFGRGEGSVLIEGDEIRILSDIEIAVVSSNPADREPLRRLSEELSASSGIETCLFWMRPDSLRRWRIKSLSFGKQPLSVKIHDILAGSRLLYGERPLASELNATLIPRWEGLRLVFNRMIEALSVDLRGLEPAAQAKATCKLVLACGDALLIDRQLYDVSLEERIARIRSICPLLPDLSPAQSSSYLALANWAMRYKLSPQPVTPAEAGELRKLAMTFSDQTLRYLLKRELALEFETYADGMQRYLRSWRPRRDYIDYRLGPVTNPLYPNLIFSAKLARGPLRPPVLAMMYALLPWDQVVYACGAILFHADQTQVEVDDALEVVRGLLVPISHLPRPESDFDAEYNVLCQATCDLWKALVG